MLAEATVVQRSDEHAQTDSLAGDSDESANKDHFLRLMFFQASRNLGGAPSEIVLPRIGDYTPLRHSMVAAGGHFTLASPSAPAPVRLDSPAVEVMTDLRKVAAVTIDADASIDFANQSMIDNRVRALIVVDDARRVNGIITATDVLSERPLQFAQARGLRRQEVVVRDIMTPADRLETLDLRDVLAARVGDIVITLRFAGRQHALVVETSDGPARIGKTVCGIFSLTHIARQLGIEIQQTHDIARTFAEIEAAIRY